ncbi:MAG: RAMP superfamily CRISPR-associated protein [Isosphaeraceae bacterium]
MSRNWVRYTLTAELLSDAHLGSGSGAVGIDALIARDRDDRPVIWASHVEGVLRDAARRLRGDEEAESFFGRAGGEQQCAIFTSLHATTSPESHVWCSTARESFKNRAPKDDTLRLIEYVPRGTKFVGGVELPASDFPTLQRLVQEVDALGGGRATGAGRVKLSLSDGGTTPIRNTGDPTGRLMLLLKNRDPLCITATATPDNLIPSLAFVPGRALLGAVAAWLITEDDRETASLLTSGKVSVSDALPLPEASVHLEGIEVLPAPLSLQSEKPTGAAGDVPWWAQPIAPAKRIDARGAEEKLKLKRPEDDLFVYRASPSKAWIAFKPVRRVRLRNGRPDPKQVDASLFAIEQIVEGTHFLAELHGSSEDLKKVAERLAPVLEGRRWLRVGRAGAPVEVAQVAWSSDRAATKPVDKALLTLTSDLLVLDEKLRWRTSLDADATRALFGEDVQLGKPQQDSVMVHGFNGTSRLWRMPAAAIRRGSVFEVSGAGVAKLVERAAKGEWLGERTHEGFGRFRIDASLPGVTDEAPASRARTPRPDIAEEVIAAKTKEWFDAHRSLTRSGGGSDRKPSLSQWLDLVADLERRDANALSSRLNPTTAGGKNWKQDDAKQVLNNLSNIEASERKLYARLFVRWLRAEMRANAPEAR